MTSNIPPIVRLAERLLVEIEQAVRGFPRYHKFTVGTELRKQAMDVALLASRAWRDRAHQREHVRQLVWDIDALKQRLQLACLLKAFASFKQFEAIARIAKDLGRQAGGWHRDLHPNGQKSKAPNAPAARAETLSTRDASTGANT